MQQAHHHFFKRISHYGTTKYFWKLHKIKALTGYGASNHIYYRSAGILSDGPVTDAILIISLSLFWLIEN